MSGGRDLVSLVSHLRIIIVRLIPNSDFQQSLPIVFLVISLFLLNSLNLDNNSSSHYQTLQEEKLLVFKDFCVCSCLPLDHRRQNYPLLFAFSATPSFCVNFISELHLPFHIFCCFYKAFLTSLLQHKITKCCSQIHTPRRWTLLSPLQASFSGNQEKAPNPPKHVELINMMSRQTVQSVWIKESDDGAGVFFLFHCHTVCLLVPLISCVMKYCLSRYLEDQIKRCFSIQPSREKIMELNVQQHLLQ